LTYKPLITNACRLEEDSIEREKRDSSRIDRKAPAIIPAVPFVIQPGHTGPENIGSGRFLLVLFFLLLLVTICRF